MIISATRATRFRLGGPKPVAEAMMGKKETFFRGSSAALTTTG